MTADALLYADCVDDALDRLWEAGFEFGPDFAVHAPMVAETLVTLGYHEVVPSWIHLNQLRRRYSAPPAVGEPIPDNVEEARRTALGDYRRVADWVQYFDRRLTERPWRDVVVEWWPCLLGGAFAAFTHGLIRTAHAVRILSVVHEPSRLQLNELARGLAYWAARYTPVPGRPEGRHPTVTTVADIPSALSELTAVNASKYVELAPRPPVPHVHSVTAPSAMRLVLPILPPELQLQSYETAVRLATGVWQAFPAGRGQRLADAGDYRPPPGELLVAEAVEIGEEHSIKLAEACLREYAERPEECYLAAAHTLNINCRQ